LFLFAGCAGGPGKNASHAPNWQATTVTSVVAPATPLAPAASAPPERLQPASPAPAARASTSRAINRNQSNAKSGGGSAWAVPDSGTGWISLQSWCRATGAVRLSRLASSGSPVFSLRSAHGNLLLRPGTRIAEWEGLQVRLGFSPQLIDNQPCVRALELTKTIVPLLRGSQPGSFGEPLVIDAGHGGDDSGAVSTSEGQNEKDLTLDWALRLRQALERKGLRVVLTRSTDAALGLSNRVDLAQAAGAGLFVSLHFNSAAPDTSEAGVETYCLTPAGMPSTLTRGYADEVEQTYPNNAFDEQNLQLAVQIHRALLEVNGHQDRGVRRARFPTVLRGQQCPAVLVEGGYLSNPAEARRIADPAYRQRLAEAVAGALEVCLGEKAR